MTKPTLKLILDGFTFTPFYMDWWGWDKDEELEVRLEFHKGENFTCDCEGPLVHRTHRTDEEEMSFHFCYRDDNHVRTCLGVQKTSELNIRKVLEKLKNTIECADNWHNQLSDLKATIEKHITSDDE